jgi:hypothetical protein
MTTSPQLSMKRNECSNRLFLLNLRPLINFLLPAISLILLHELSELPSSTNMISNENPDGHYFLNPF